MWHTAPWPETRGRTADGCGRVVAWPFSGLCQAVFSWRAPARPGGRVDLGNGLLIHPTQVRILPGALVDLRACPEGTRPVSQKCHWKSRTRWSLPDHALQRGALVAFVDVSVRVQRERDGAVSEALRHNVGTRSRRE